jgi:hypothetical protein
MANPGDNWVQSGLTNTVTTTTVQDFYTRGGSATYVINGSTDPNGTHYWMDIVCYSGTYGSSTTSRDWQIRLGKYGPYQYVMTRARGNIAGQPGVYGTNGTTYAATGSNYNNVWVSTNNGVSWTYSGVGYLSMIGPAMTYPPINGVSLSAVVDNLCFRCGAASLGSTGYNAPDGFPYHNQYGDGRTVGGTGSAGGYGGSRYFYGGCYLTMDSWVTTILNAAVGNFGSGDIRWSFLTDTSNGYYLGDIGASGGSTPQLSWSIAIQNIMAGNAGYQASTDTPVIRMRNFFSLARSSTYYDNFSGTNYLYGNLTLNYLRPGYDTYGTNTITISGSTSRKMYLYSSYLHPILAYTSTPATDSTQIQLYSHVNYAQSVLRVGTGPRGGVNP